MNIRVFRLRDAAQVIGLAQWLTKHFKEKKFPVRVTIERFRPLRNLDQNAKWHAMVSEIAEQTGNDVKSTKADIKQLFCPQVEGLRGVMRPQSTSKLSTVQFADLIEQTFALGVEYGVVFSQ